VEKGSIISAAADIFNLSFRKLNPEPIPESMRIFVSDDTFIIFVFNSKFITGSVKYLIFTNGSNK